MKTAFKTILVLLLCFCLTAPALSEGTGSVPVLIFEDSFDGEALDRSKWAPCPNWVRQDGLSVWDSKLIRLNGQGQLVLRAEWDEKARRVRAGAVRTMGLFSLGTGITRPPSAFPSPPGSGALSG